MKHHRLLVSIALIILITASALLAAEPPSTPPQTGSFTLDAAQVDPRMFAEIHRREGLPAVVGSMYPNKGNDGKHPESPDAPTKLVVWVSPNYKPDGTWGLLVLPSNADDPGVSAGYQKIGEKHRLIMVAPQNGGNYHYREWRVAHAVIARQEMFKRYKVNAARVYLSGPSGGGRISSATAFLFPDMFNGALCNCGVDTIQINGALPPKADPVSALPDLIRTAQENTRFYLYTGSKDINHDDTLQAYNWMKKYGFKHVTFYSQDGASHAEMSDANFETGLAALDAPLETNAAIKLKQATAFAKQGLTGQAMMAFQQAIATAPCSDAGTQAQTQLEPLLTSYQQELDQTKTTVASSDHVAANAAITKFAHTYLPYAKDDLVALRNALAKPAR
jgi:hypothetical protein